MDCKQRDVTYANLFSSPLTNFKLKFAFFQPEKTHMVLNNRYLCISCHGTSCTNDRPENCIFLLAHCGGTAIAMKAMYRVVASSTHSFISFHHLNFLRSSREVHFNTDFFFLTSFLHSFTSSKQKRLISDRRKSFDLNATKPTPEEVLGLQRAMPKPCKKNKLCGISLEMVLLE